MAVLYNAINSFIFFGQRPPARFWTAAALVPGAVTVDNIWWAVAVAAAVNVARTLISALTGKLRE